MRTVWLDNEQALDRFASEYAQTLCGGEIIGLVGDLGAGKTSFVQRVAAALGVKEQVKSPTFILMQVFHAEGGSGGKTIARLCHVDAYRMHDESELEAIGFDEYAGQPDTVTFVEWADRTPSLHALPGYAEISFDFAPRGGRIARLERNNRP